MTEEQPVQALNLDLAQQESFVRFYRNLPEKASATVRFFHRSEFYTVHEDDARLAAEYLFGTHTIKYMGTEPKLSYLVVSRTNFEKFVRDLLLVRQYRVQVYVKPSQSKNNDWLLEYQGSPGNLAQFEKIIFENNEIIFNSAVMVVKIVKNTMLAIACINSTDSEFFVSEFNDNELFTELEMHVAQIGPKECVIPQGHTAELSTLQSLLERNGVLVAKLKPSEFKCTDGVDQDLARLLYFSDDQQRNAKSLPETNLTEAMGCLQVGIKYLNLTEDQQNFNQFSLKIFDSHRFVRLDTAAISALNLLPETENRGEKYSSVFGILDKCSTAQGRRLLVQWIKQPLRDMNHINERLEIVEAFLRDTETRHSLSSNNLTRVPDLLLLAKKLGVKKGTLQDCYRVYQTVRNVGPLVNILSECENKYMKAMLIDPLCDLLTDMEKYLCMIEETIDLDVVDRGEIFIKASYSDALGDLKRQKTQVEENMQKVFNAASRNLGFESGKTMKLECTEQHGYFFRVTLKEERALRANKDYEIIDAIKGGVRFTNDKLTRLNNAYKEIINEYEQHQKDVVTEILHIAAGYANTLRNINLCIAKIDVLVAFANVAANAPIPYVRPKLHDEESRVLRLKKVRHPCLEMYDGVPFIPNDVEFKTDEKMMYVITGPNMGGKSTYIRSVGVAVLLAHIGSFVPCTEADIPLVDSIMARVGATDSQIKGLSTFMMEMVETASILKTATSHSLVLIDELGRGTSTYDGCGMAWSIAEYLATEIKCFSLFATHFHELTQISETLPTVHNLHVTAVITEKTITPLYQIKEGGCDKSYGIHCARLADFPSDVIDMAVQQQNLLEGNQGMSRIKDYEIDLKRQVVKEGDDLLKNALDECKKLNIDQLSDEDLMANINRIKRDLLSKDNAFVQGLLGE